MNPQEQFSPTMPSQPPKMFTQHPMYPTQQFYNSQHQQYQVQQNQTPSLHVILEKLDNMDRRLNKLDSIETQIVEMNKSVLLMGSRISSVERTMNETNTKLFDLEVSRNFDSQLCEELKQKQVTKEKTVESESEKMRKVTNDMNTLKSRNERLTKVIIDLQSRSMRDNLLVFNIVECTTKEDRKTELHTKDYTFHGERPSDRRGR